VKRVAAGIEDCGEATAVAEPAEGVNQGQQGSDDGIAEHDMEQQLPVRPTSAVGAAPQVLSRRSFDDLVEVGSGPLHLLADLDMVH
jgi:hypothetical protein